MKGFSDEERDRIRETLMDDGRDLFERYGLQKTTIADLTDAAGIADSTFYRFFDSKEELYFEILQREGHELADTLVAETRSLPTRWQARTTHSEPSPSSCTSWSKPSRRTDSCGDCWSKTNSWK
jgi:AcrR family transcriptional regulator